MAVSDPVADFLTCVRNAVRARQRKVDVPASRLKTEIAKALLRGRFINNFKVIEDRQQGILRVYLKYVDEDVSVINGIRRVSTPGRRVYVGKAKIPRVMGGLGTTILSTPRGLMTDREAREAGLGGEILCQVW
ncbi:MAG: 30S ribosomal protein S8 [Candidatus Eisenbacteria bacterium]|uniref:Small ribosomal subunit protein uS8 n=1 Tax=Eiseniibacteriota bacterium TaxID=2212470 RepID=A0A538TX87_UNCEI|nr:MAG: 30S ribosomal protein S8 [Candidatus Eisenbacteria bacterium]